MATFKNSPADRVAAAAMTAARAGREYNPVTQQWSGGGSDPNWTGDKDTTGNPQYVRDVSQTGGGGGGGGDTAPAKSWEQLQYEQAEAYRRKNAAAALEGLMSTYNLGSLMGKINAWIAEGYEGSAIEALIRQQPEYAARFPAMKQLQAQGKSISEREYIDYEQAMTGYESLYGLPKGMLSEASMVTKLLVNGKSAREVEENANRAAASIYKLPKEFRDSMKRNYGVDSGGLTAYFLDPDIATPMLERQFVSAQIGMEAWRNKVDINKDFMEELYAQGVTAEKAAEGFETVGRQAGFSAGKGETADQKTLIDANLTSGAAAKDKVQRVGQTRANRFEGGGGFAGGDRGVSGVGSSST